MSSISKSLGIIVLGMVCVPVVFVLLVTSKGGGTALFLLYMLGGMMLLFGLPVWLIAKFIHKAVDRPENSDRPDR